MSKISHSIYKARTRVRRVSIRPIARKSKIKYFYKGLSCKRGYEDRHISKLTEAKVPAIKTSLKH